MTKFSFAQLASSWHSQLTLHGHSLHDGQVRSLHELSVKLVPKQRSSFCPNSQQFTVVNEPVVQPVGDGDDVGLPNLTAQGYPENLLTMISYLSPSNFPRAADTALNGHVASN